MDIYQKLEQYTQYSLGDLSKECRLEYEDITLENIDFSKYDLNNSTFVGVKFMDCDFSNVYLSGSLFGGSYMEQCVMKKNILRKADWSNIIMKNMTISDLDAFRTNIYEGYFENVVFSSGRLERCILTKSIMKNVTFVQCNLTEASFDKIEFDNVSFNNCIFCQTEFSRKLENVSFKNVTLIVDETKYLNLGNEVKQLLL